MTDWLRVIGAHLWLLLKGLIGVVVVLGIGWIAWSHWKLAQFRFTDAQQKAIQDSQRGRRPMWVKDRQKNDQSRVDGEC